MLNCPYPLDDLAPQVTVIPSVLPGDYPGAGPPGVCSVAHAGPPAAAARQAACHPGLTGPLGGLPGGAFRHVGLQH
jgi:hypothetical protein